MRAGTNLESLSGPLQPGLRFFHHPIPAPPTASLAGCLPPSDLLKGWAEGRAYYVLCDTDAASNTATSRLGSVSPPVVQRRRIPIAYGNSQPHTVLVKANSSLGLSLITRVQPTIHITLPMRQSPSPLTALLLAVSIGSLARLRYRRSGGTLSSRLHTPPLPATHA